MMGDQDPVVPDQSLALDVWSLNALGGCGGVGVVAWSGLVWGACGPPRREIQGLVLWLLVVTHGAVLAVLPSLAKWGRSERRSAFIPIWRLRD